MGRSEEEVEKGTEGTQEEWVGKGRGGEADQEGPGLLPRLLLHLVGVSGASSRVSFSQIKVPTPHPTPTPLPQLGHSPALEDPRFSWPRLHLETSTVPPSRPPSCASQDCQPFCYSPDQSPGPCPLSQPGRGLALDSPSRGGSPLGLQTSSVWALLTLKFNVST